MLISALAFTLLNVFVKYLVSFDTFQIVFFRSLGSLVFTMSFLLKNKISILGNSKMLMIVRSFVGLTAMSLFFISLKYLTVGSAVSLRYIAPIFATFFALILLKEKIKNIQWLFLGIAFLGVLILKGFDTQLNTIGFVYAIASAFFSGLVFIIIRKIGDKDHPIVIVNYFMAIATLVGGVLAINNWTTPVGVEWLLLGSLGVFGFFGQLYLTKAFQTTETNQVAPFKYVEVIMTMIIGLFWFQETYTLWSVLGILLILVGLTSNVLVKRNKKIKNIFKRSYYTRSS